VSAANLRLLLDGSTIVASHRTGDPRVQDAYSLRCAPQVHGAARDALTYAEQCADCELASAIDNPVVLADGRVESVGNFHGAPLGGDSICAHRSRPPGARRQPATRCGLRGSAVPVLTGCSHPSSTAPRTPSRQATSSPPSKPRSGCLAEGHRVVQAPRGPERS